MDRPTPGAHELGAGRPLAEVYWDIAWSQLTGSLGVQQASHRVEIAFEAGEPVRGTSSAQSESLVRFLLARRHVDAEQLDRATLLTVRHRTKVEDELVSAGAISRGDLLAARREHARGIVVASFRMRQPITTFQAEGGAGTVGGSDGGDMLGLIRTAVEKSLGFDALASALAGWSHMPLVRTLAAPVISPIIRLAPDERRLLEAVDGHRSIGALLATMGWDPSRLFPSLYLCRCLKLVRGQADPEPVVALPPGSSVAEPTMTVLPALPPPPPRARTPVAPPVRPPGMGVALPGRRTTSAIAVPSGMETDLEVRRRVLARRKSGAVPRESTGADRTESHVVGLQDGPNDTPVVAALAFDGFQVIRPLGRGGWGWVYQAHQERLDRMVAIKVLSPQLPRDPQFIDRFFREAKSVARLNHPNVVTVFDCNESAGVRYLVMELVDGVTLRDIVADGGPLPERDAVWVCSCIALALEHAHSRAVLHRDVKPENVFLSLEGVVKLGDWGLAKGFSGDSNITETGFALGTPNYMSPEQLRASREIDHRADIYSLGAVLYFLVTGYPPYEGPSIVDIMASHLLDPPPDPRRRNPMASDGLAAVIYRAMAKEPAGRFGTASEMIEALQTLPGAGRIERLL